MTRDFVAQAETLAPLLERTARQSELARQPLDEVIHAIAATDLFAMMTPKRYGGFEADMDVYFDVVLTLSQADMSLGWLTSFYIEHNWWVCHLPQHVQDEVFAERNYMLAPGALAMSSGTATPVEGGYVLDGQWAWGTGIVHADWVMAGAMISPQGGPEGTSPRPAFFFVPASETELVDTWHMAGMCGTGSHDFKIEGRFVPQERAVGFVEMAYGLTGITDRYEAPLYATPMLTLLGIAASTPILGGAKRAVHEFCEQMQSKSAQRRGHCRTKTARVRCLRQRRPWPSRAPSSCCVVSLPS